MSRYRFLVIIFACLTATVLASLRLKQSAPTQPTAILVIEGSNTMDLLVRIWAQEYTKDNSNLSTHVIPADSGKGITALINRTVDLAAASRDLTKEEINLAKSKGIRLKRITVARDAIAIIVNPNNPVNELKLSQVKGIFNGEITDWRQVGGLSAHIDPFCRKQSSGTYNYFKQEVLNGNGYSVNAKSLSDSKAVIEAVQNEKNSIGYVGLRDALAAGEKIKLVRLKLTDNTHAVPPNKSSLIHDYPIGRPLFLFYDSLAKQSVKQFIDFCLSTRGQKLALANGYVSLDDK